MPQTPTGPGRTRTIATIASIASIALSAMALAMSATGSHATPRTSGELAERRTAPDGIDAASDTIRKEPARPEPTPRHRPAEAQAHGPEPRPAGRPGNPLGESLERRQRWQQDAFRAHCTPGMRYDVRIESQTRDGTVPHPDAPNRWDRHDLVAATHGPYLPPLPTADAHTIAIVLTDACTTGAEASLGIRLERHPHESRADDPWTAELASEGAWITGDAATVRDAVGRWLRHWAAQRDPRQARRDAGHRREGGSRYRLQRDPRRHQRRMRERMAPGWNHDGKPDSMPDAPPPADGRQGLRLRPAPWDPRRELQRERETGRDQRTPGGPSAPRHDPTPPAPHAG